jgi:hypothetical protein
MNPVMLAPIVGMEPWEADARSLPRDLRYVLQAVEAGHACS